MSQLIMVPSPNGPVVYKISIESKNLDNFRPSPTSNTTPPPTIPSESIQQKLAAGLVSGLLFAIVCACMVIIVVCRWRRFTRLKVTHTVHQNTYSGMPLAQYSVIERSNLGSESELRSDPPVGQYSVVHSGSPQHETHFNTATQITGNGASVSGVSPPIPHHSPVQTKVVTGLVYAKVNPMIPAVPPPKTQDGQRVAYVTVWADAVVPPLPSDTKRKADVSVSLDQILIQLGEVAPDWRRLAESLEIEGVDDIAQYVSSEHDAMVEVVDGWLRKLYPKVPTWREIAGVVEGLGYSNLAYCLRQVYVTGYLPIEVSNAVSPTVPVSASPPPIPPRLDHEPLPPHNDQPSSPCLSLRQHQPSLLPTMWTNHHTH
ncbi:hypothetical protein GBAR_LOCUS19041 [Geodia barretti]|uniref:Death domain-containing protein n=1 Tax=Geodia barretti TaxID=519541 RepID=A0AA35WYX7_GEOBA|nr:hypothetical protein GBAR_LOCUS19041 [Geodia barretti]